LQPFDEKCKEKIKNYHLNIFTWCRLKLRRNTSYPSRCSKISALKSSAIKPKLLVTLVGYQHIIINVSLNPLTFHLSNTNLWKKKLCKFSEIFDRYVISPEEMERVVPFGVNYSLLLRDFESNIPWILCSWKVFLMAILKNI